MADDIPADKRLEHMFNKLWNDPNLGPQIQAATKQEFPDVVTQQDQFAPVLAPVMKQLEESQAELKALREERAAEALARQEKEKADYQAAFESNFAAAASAYNLTDEGKQAAIDHMQKTKAYDPEAACALIASKMPAVTVPKAKRTVEPLFESLKGDQSDRYALLHKDPDAFLDQEFAELEADPDRYIQEAFGQYAA